KGFAEGDGRDFVGVENTARTQHAPGLRESVTDVFEMVQDSVTGHHVKESVRERKRFGGRLACRNVGPAFDERQHFTGNVDAVELLEQIVADVEDESGAAADV